MVAVSPVFCSIVYKDFFIRINVAGGNQHHFVIPFDYHGIT
jgi:hypothetical protein